MRFRLKPFKSIQQLFEDGLTVMASRFWTFFGCLLIPLVLLSVLIFGRPTKMWDWRWWYGLDCFPNWKRLVCVCVCRLPVIKMLQSYWSEWLLKNMTNGLALRLLFSQVVSEEQTWLRCFNREVHLRSEYYVHVFCCVNLVSIEASCSCMWFPYKSYINHHLSSFISHIHFSP